MHFIISTQSSLWQQFLSFSVFYHATKTQQQTLSFFTKFSNLITQTCHHRYSYSTNNHMNTFCSFISCAHLVKRFSWSHTTDTVTNLISRVSVFLVWRCILVWATLSWDYGENTALRILRIKCYNRINMQIVTISWQEFNIRTNKLVYVNVYCYR